MNADKKVSSEILAEHPRDQSNVVCPCSGTTRDQIVRLLDEGVADPERISRITGACSGCGACEPEVLDLMAEYDRSASFQASKENG